MATSKLIRFSGPLLFELISSARSAFPKPRTGLLNRNFAALFSSSSVVSNKKQMPTKPCYKDEDVSLPCLKKLLMENDIQLFDVRNPDELLETGAIPGAVNIPLDEISAAFGLLPDVFEQVYSVPKPGRGDDNITFHCKSGKRARKAIEILQGLGYYGMHNYTGGWLEWQKTLEQDNELREEQ